MKKYEKRANKKKKYEKLLYRRFDAARQDESVVSIVCDLFGFR